MLLTSSWFDFGNLPYVKMCTCKHCGCSNEDAVDNKVSIHELENHPPVEAHGHGATTFFSHTV